MGRFQETFICIYCKKTLPEIKPSKSHVIPDFLGGVLELNNAVCIECNNRVNREIEKLMIKPFAYLRSGLDLRGRRRRDIKVSAEVKILGVKIKTKLSSGIQIPPFEYQKPNGEKGLVIVGEKDYVEKEKRKIESNTRKKWNWEEIEGVPEFEVLIKVLPLEVLRDNEGRKLAAKIAFERFCQMRSSTVLVDSCYDGIREFILTGNAGSIFSNLFFDDKVMNRNFNIPFPWHGIFFMQRRYKLISIVTLFGLFYFLTILTNRMPIFANWEECILIHPQTKQKIEPILRGSVFPTIPTTAFEINDDTYRKAARYALTKFDETLRRARATTIISKRKA